MKYLNLCCLTYVNTILIYFNNKGNSSLFETIIERCKKRVAL